MTNSYRAEDQVYNGFCRRYDKIEINSNRKGEDKMVENKNEVNTAFEILLEEIENVVEGLNQEAEKTFKSRNYERVKTLIEDATKLTEFREAVKKLQEEWQNLFAPRIPKSKKRRTYQKLGRGLRTPEDVFRIPILKSLVELNGKASITDVLNKVYYKMKDKLNEYDLQPMPSNPDIKRWENTAQWCRYTLVKEGLLASGSPRGIWEITEKGIEYLKAAKGRDV